MTTEPEIKRGDGRTLMPLRLLSDGELAVRSAGVEGDPGVPEGSSVELIDHPIYGPDLAFSFCLEFCHERIADLELTEGELYLNQWYRWERFVRLYGAVENTDSVGDHQHVDDLFAYGVCPRVPEQEIVQVFLHMEREVNEILLRFGIKPRTPPTIA